MTSWTTSQVTADGVALAVHRVGRGPPLVCLTAIAHDVHDFDALAERVSDRLTLICIEWPSHGASGADREPASARRFADLLTAALDQLALPPAILLGNSIGGAAAILHATRRPVRALVLCDSGGLAETTPFVRRFCRLFAGFFAAGERGAAWYGPAFRAYYSRVLTGRAARPQRRRITASGRRMARPLREAWASFGAPEADIRAEAWGLEAPIWVAWAKGDWVIPYAVCRPAIERLRNATVSLFPGGHSAFLEAPDAFAAGLLAFAAGLPAAPALRVAS